MSGYEKPPQKWDEASIIALVVVALVLFGYGYCMCG
jgi:hypothetical protein